LQRGLDTQLPAGLDLYTVIDDCVQEGMPYGTEWHACFYKHTRPNGDRVRFANFHCEDYVGNVDDPLNVGDPHAIPGTYAAGIPHAHSTMEYRSGTAYPLNPWIAMWQGLENRKEADGFIRAHVAPPDPCPAPNRSSFIGLSQGERGA